MVGSRLNIRHLNTMWRLIGILICGTLLVCAAPEPGPQLWDVSASAHHRVVRELADDGHIDIWGHHPTSAKVLVEPSNIRRVSRALSEADISHNILVPDILELVDQERVHMQQKKKHFRAKRAAQSQTAFNNNGVPQAINQMDWTTYHELEDIDGYTLNLAQTYPDWVHVKSAGKSVEGKPIYVVKITDPNSTGPKQKIFIEGGIHAREWISPAVTTYLMKEAVTNDAWRELLQFTVWYFVPVANPDGYKYSFSPDRRARLWRKNRQDNDQSCKGVDLNRNWNLGWGVGASESPCSETYRGIKAFSEPETNALQKFMRGVGEIDLFITFHSFGQTVLYPWGWTLQPPSNKKSLELIANKFVKEVKSRGSSEYEVGGSGPLYGLASGATDDWAYGVLGVPFSYTIELPDDGTWGFLLPENRIFNTVTETASGVYCMVSYLSNTGRCAAKRQNLFRFPR